MTWEERMAARAAARQKIVEHEESEQDKISWEQQQEQWIQQYAASLTPQTALKEQQWMEENPIGCACIGGPLCCNIRYQARERVLNQ